MPRIPEPASERPPDAQGFSSLGLEVNLEDLPVTGHFPTWLTGTLIRNGPARFEVGTESYRQWFDGLAMLHKFSFRDGHVSYANRFLDTGDFREAAEQGRITRRAFATDPCRTIFGRVMAMFVPAAADNANVNINILAERCVALSETSLPITFDRGTLRSTVFSRLAARSPDNSRRPTPIWISAADSPRTTGRGWAERAATTSSRPMTLARRDHQLAVGLTVQPTCIRSP